MDFGYRENAEMSFREFKGTIKVDFVDLLPTKSMFCTVGNLKSDRKV